MNATTYTGVRSAGVTSPASQTRHQMAKHHQRARRRSSAPATAAPAPATASEPRPEARPLRQRQIGTPAETLPSASPSRSTRPSGSPAPLPAAPGAYAAFTVRRRKVRLQQRTHIRRQNAVEKQQPSASGTAACPATGPPPPPPHDQRRKQCHNRRVRRRLPQSFSASCCSRHLLSVHQPHQIAQRAHAA
jgi:hypothetical protein